MFYVLLLVAIMGLCFVFSHIKGALWVPARAKDTNAMLRQLKLKPGMNVYEFGCGDGRFLRKASAYNVQAVGYEINIFMWTLARIFCHQKNISVRLGDAWNKSFAPADVVYAFLMPKFMSNFGAKLRRELRPGSTIVTYVFPIPDMEHYLFENGFYFYRVKARYTLPKPMP